MKKLRKVWAVILSMLLLFTTVLATDHIDVHAAATQLSFSIAIADGGGSLQYAFGNGDLTAAVNQASVNIPEGETAHLKLKATVNQGFEVGNYKIIDKGTDNTGNTELGGVNSGGVQGENGQVFDLDPTHHYEVQFEIRVASGGGGNPPSNNGSLTFQNQGPSAGGTISYRLNGNGNYIPVTDLSTSVDVSAASSIDFKLEANAEYQIDNHRGIKIYVDGTPNELNGNNGLYSYTFSEPANHKYQLCFGFESTSGGGGGNQPINNPVTLTFNVSGQTQPYIGVEEIMVDNTNRATIQNNTGSVEVESATNHDLVLRAYFGSKITSASVDGTACTISADGQTATITVSEKTEAYAVSVTATDSDDVTILWTHDPAEKNGAWSDAYIERGTGTVQFVKLERNGVEVQPGVGSNYNENGGYYQCKRGDIVTLKFVPAAGYQLTSASLNGHTLEAQAEQSTFKVTMAGNFHLAGSFTKTSAQTKVASSTNVTGLSVSGTDAAINTGNVAVGVTGGQANPTDNEIEAAMGADSADFVEAVETVDITMTNVISKGGAGDYFSASGNYWTNPMTDLTTPATVSLAVANKLSPGETYSVVRKHGTKLTEIDATYNSSTGLLTFGSNAFSDYTIIKKKGTPETNPKPAETKNEESNDSSPSSSNNDEDNNNVTIPPKTNLGKVVDGTVIENWTDLEKLLSGNKGTKKTGKLIEIILNKHDATIPESTFKELEGSNVSGLHMFVESGTALTFVNNKRLKKQKALDLTCKIETTKKIKKIIFRSKENLNALTILHTVVPAGTKRVTVYVIDIRGQRRKIGTVRPTAEGRLCFVIGSLGTYELEY